MTSQKKYPKVYIILVNYCGWVNTIECLESLLRMEYDNYQIVVVDNASNDGSVAKFRFWAEGKMDIIGNLGYSLKHLSFPPVPKPVYYVEYNRKQSEEGNFKKQENHSSILHKIPAPLVFINSGGNLGFAGGNNVGLRYALKDDNFQYAWLLNNDTVVEPSALKKMVKRLHEKPSAGMCGSTLCYYFHPKAIQALGGSTYNKWLGWNRFVSETEQTPTVLDPAVIERSLFDISGASMLVSRPFLETVGLMSEDYFLYFEELDWSVRSRNKFALAYAAESVVYHKGSASIRKGTTKDKISIFSDYYMQKNKIVFTRKHFPYALPTIYFGLILTFIKSIVKKQWKRAILILKIMFGFTRNKPMNPSE